MISEDAKKAGKPKPNIGARIDHALHAEFLRVKELSGKTESQLLNEALSLYLGVGSNTVPDRISQLESNLAKLQQQVDEVLGKFRRLATR
jgi:hypothetical protein